MTTNRIGRRMAELHDIASAMPGACKNDLLRAVGLKLRGPGTGRELSRAVKAGLIIVERVRPNLCRCFATTRDQRAWHLRQALLRPGASPERIAHIRAELDALQAERAATWTDCWCDWPDPAYPGRTHGEHIEVYDYPDHEPSPEWNVPEPVSA